MLSTLAPGVPDGRDPAAVGGERRRAVVPRLAEGAQGQALSVAQLDRHGRLRLARVEDEEPRRRSGKGRERGARENEDPVDDGAGRTRDLSLPGVEGLRHEHRFAREEKVPGGVLGLGLRLHDEPRRGAVDRSEEDLALTAAGGTGEVEEGPAVGQEAGMPVGVVPFAEAREGRRLSTRSGHAPERRARRGGQDDDVVLSPASALAVEGTTDRQRGSPLDRRLLELPVDAREEGDPAPVRRPERELRPLRTGERGDPAVRDRPDVEERGRVAGLGGEGDARAVGRKRDGAGAADPQVEGGARRRKELGGDDVRGGARANGEEERRREGRGDRPGERHQQEAARTGRRRDGELVALRGFQEEVPRLADPGEAFPRVAREAAAQDVRDGRRRRRREEAEVDLARQDGREDVADRLAVEETLPGQHLEEDDAEGPDVRPAVDRLAAGLLGRHVGRRAEEDSRLRRVGREGGGVLDLRGRGARRVHRLGEAEVEDLDLSVGRELHVGGLEVAVDDPLLVRGLERLGDLPRDGEGLVERERAALQPFGEVFALDELHDEGADAARLLEAVDRGDVGVLQLGEDLRLALEAREAVGVRGERLGEDLDRDLALQLRSRSPGRPRPFRPRRAGR